MGYCDNCSRTLLPCPDCRGQAGGYSIAGLLTCRSCANTGRICEQHGNDWRKMV